MTIFAFVILAKNEKCSTKNVKSISWAILISSFGETWCPLGVITNYKGNEVEKYLCSPNFILKS